VSEMIKRSRVESREGQARFEPVLKAVIRMDRQVTSLLQRVVFFGEMRSICEY